GSGRQRPGEPGGPAAAAPWRRTARPAGSPPGPSARSDTARTARRRRPAPAGPPGCQSRPRRSRWPAGQNSLRSAAAAPPAGPGPRRRLRYERSYDDLLPPRGGQTERKEPAGMQSSNQPLVSIILPVYNAQNHIARCIESIRAQTYRNFQLIILNDGSRDVSLPVCEMFRKVDGRILLVDKDNSGVSDTRNLGLKLAEGEYVQFVDSDDYLDPGYTESLVRAAEENRADLVIAPYQMVIPRSEAPARRLREKLSGLLPGQLPGAVQPDAGEQPPEVRTYSFLAPGLYDTDSFALHLMDKPASYYYSVLWNKLY